MAGDIVRFLCELLPHTPMLAELNIESAHESDLLNIFGCLSRHCEHLRSLTLNSCDRVPSVLQNIFPLDEHGTLRCCLPKLIELNISPYSADDDTDLQLQVMSLRRCLPEMRFRLDAADHNDLSFDCDWLAEQIKQELWLVYCV